MEQRLTVEDVIRITVSDLENIMVPAGLIDQIGMPVQNAIRNLYGCLDAIDRDKQQKAAEQEPSEQDPEAPEIDVEVIGDE